MVYKGRVDIPCDFGTDSDEFKIHVGRFPRNKGELEEFASCQKKGMDSQLDWDVISQCAGDNFK